MVWQVTTVKEASNILGAKIIRGRRVLCSKGDLRSHKIRCRWVATEVNTGDDLTYYAAAPPLDAKRLLFSKYAHQRKQKGAKLELVARYHKRVV